ncbi:MAG TPA: sn-glycerol-3-phosphate ABC transporter ATP-binding protein UgpC [Acidimicrobiales bacterium]|nr:sn-glycerol-3-phosphate ABC transporter ATP-binding protein UgpC [Acidimicrobiales bacterium]
MAGVGLEKVSKVFENGFAAVNEMSLEVDDGEFLVLVGPSGCGKTTALRMVAGLEDVTSGTIRIGDRVVNDLLPKDRDIAMVFQNYALYPHMTVAQNIGFGLKLRHMPRDEIAQRVGEAAHLLGLEEMLERRPRQLSGGQRQRVAMGRAIVRQPQVFLMDEPLSNLDAKLRIQMRADIARLQQRLGVTTVYVTHDQVEAMTMGRRVAVMRKGLLLQVDTPRALYDHPDNLFVAGFIGSPPMNLAEGVLHAGAEGAWVELGHQRLEVGPEALAARPRLLAYDGARLAVGIRPEDIEDASLGPAPPEGRLLEARAELTEALGSSLVVHFSVAAPPVSTEETRELAKDRGHDAAAVAPAEGETRFVAAFSPRSRVEAGDNVVATVDTARLHFFDLADGTAIWG